MTEAIDNLDPSSEVVLVSYEGIMSLGESYLFDIYRQLGINSTYTPSFKDGNAKYVVAPPTSPKKKTSKRAFFNMFNQDFNHASPQMLRRADATSMRLLNPANNGRDRKQKRAGQH
jgi:hypothetical protein